MKEIRNGIYSSPTEVISNAISFVNPFHGAVAKNARAARVTRDGTICAKNSTFKAMIYISMKSTPYLQKVSSYGLLSRLRYIWLLVEYKNAILCNFAA